METKLRTLQQIRELASLALEREIDPLIAARAIDAHATSVGLGFERPFIVLKGIVSQADEIPDPDELRQWMSAAASAKQQERETFLQQFGDQILRVCQDIQAFVSHEEG